MTPLSPALSVRMRMLLEGVVEQLSGKLLPELVVEHAWYDANYVGWSGDKIAAWRGWSVNLRQFGDYRTLYIDYVTNQFSFEKNSELFGEHFATTIAHLSEYVCLYVTACGTKTSSQLEAAGFTYKTFQRSLHPSRVITLSQFTDNNLSIYIRDGLSLILFQRDHC